jgi:hypothetical protein
MKFKYAKYGKDTFRPVIPVFLKNDRIRIGYEVLVDSGADLCLFHADIGEAIGLDIEKGKPREVFGVGGKVSVYYLHPITLVVGGWEYDIEAGFMPAVSGRSMPYGLVGQKGFFEFFKVTFDHASKDIEIKPKAK